jgi:hypothetical protein
MKLSRRAIFAQMFILGYSLSIFGQVEKPLTSGIEDLTDKELVSKLNSSDSKEAAQIAIEIVKRGEKTLRFLFYLKNNKQIYRGIDCLKHPDDFIFDSNDIVVEVVALYLISAIYYDNIAFANAPYLVTTNKNAEDHTLNRPERIKKAWKATESWFKKLRETNLEKLREVNEFPLKSSNVHFLGTNPKRQNKPTDCRY